MEEWTKEHMGSWMVELLNEKTDENEELTNKWVDKECDWKNEWTNGWIIDGIAEWTNTWKWMDIE